MASRLSIVEGVGACLSFFTSGAYSPGESLLVVDVVVDELVLDVPLLCGSVVCGTVVGVLGAVPGPVPAPGVDVPGEAGYCVPLGY
jgi:hypothetical protein